MARLNPDGTYSGRAGNIVYYTRNGKTFMKEYKIPTDPKKPKQLSQRARMSAASSFISRFRKIIDIGFQGSDTNSSGYQEAMEYHMGNALRDVTPQGDEKPVFEVIIEDVKISRGLIDPPVVDACEREGNKITVNWDPTLGNLINKLFDSLVIVAYTPEKGTFADYHVGRREQGTGTTMLPAKFNAPVHLWAFYLNQEKNQVKGKENVSGSVYLGEF